MYEIKSITGLRWFAAASVFMYHFGTPTWFPNSFKNFQFNGFFGVQFFFVLSGYVLTIRYTDKPLETKGYLLARFARIAPMYFIGLLIGTAYYANRPVNFDLRLFLEHIFGLQAWNKDFDRVASFNGPAWTISVEMFFYILFPLIAAIMRPTVRSMTKSCVVVLCSATFGAALTTLHIVQFGSLDPAKVEVPNEFLWFRGVPIFYLGLFIGGIGAANFAMSAMALPGNHPLRRFFQPIIFAVTILFLLFNLNFNSVDNAQLKLYTQFSLAIFPVSLLLIGLHLHPESLLSKFLSLRPIHLLGKVSFSFYILHFPFISIVRTNWPDSSYDAQFMILLALSIFLFFLYEEPLRKRMVSKI